MSDESALCAAMQASPADPMPRLVYADWLDENSRPLDAALMRVLAEPGEDRHRLDYATACERLANRLKAGGGYVWASRYDTARCLREYAEFIRVQVEAERLEPVYQKECRRLAENADAWQVTWRLNPNSSFLEGAKLFRRAADLLNDDRNGGGWRAWCRPCEGLIPGAGRYSDHLIFRRGFVDDVRCPGTLWLTYAEVVLTAQPVTRVVVTAIPGPGDERMCALAKKHRYDWLPTEIGPELANARRFMLELFALEWPRIAFEFRP